MNTNRVLGKTVHAVGLVVGGLIFCGFDSYKYPLEQIERDPKLQKIVELQARSGQQTALYSEHYSITKQCLHDSHVQDDVAERLSLKVCDIDLDNWHNPQHYEAKNHCDRAVKTSNYGAFGSALRYHRERIAESWHSLSYGDVDNVVKILARALHGEEDFFSHSNFVDMSPVTQDELIGCWTRYAASKERDHDENYALIEKDLRCIETGFNSSQNELDNLLITGFDPREPDPYAPRGDSYPHRKFAKDNANYGVDAKSLIKNGTMTKFAAAKRAAISACVGTVTDFSRLCKLDSNCRLHWAKMFVAGNKK
jgi:hypothetical protein